MATNYPSNLDTWPTIGPLLSSTPHSEVHEDLQDAIEAIQTELGTNPKGANATVRDRIAGVDIRVAQCREYYPDVASLPASGDFPGQTVWVENITRQYSWDGTNWKITGGNMPGCRMYRNTGHLDVSTSGSNIDLAGHSGIAGGYRTGGIITVPAGAGGVYYLDFGGEFTTGASFRFSTAVAIADNAGIVDTLAPSQLIAEELFESGVSAFPHCGLSKVVALAGGATVTLSGRVSASSRGPTASYIGLQMLEHRPEWT